MKSSRLKHGSPFFLAFTYFLRMSFRFSLLINAFLVNESNSTFLQPNRHYSFPRFNFFFPFLFFCSAQNEKTMNPFGLSVLNTAAVLPSRLSNITSAHTQQQKTLYEYIIRNASRSPSLSLYALCRACQCVCVCACVVYVCVNEEKKE